MSRAALLLLAVAACVDHEPDLWKGTTSLEVVLVNPTDGGSMMNRLPDTTRAITIKVTAKDDQGLVDTTVSRDVDLYVQFLGSLTPDHQSGVPFQKITLAAGVSQPTVVNLPPTFGQTVLWLEDVEGTDPSYATGTSPALWYRDPYIADIQRPVDENSPTALTDSPLENKTVAVTASRYGAMGRLVVTAVFSAGFTLDDVKCADANGTPPCQAGDYDHAYIYSYSRATDQSGDTIKLGENIDGFQGADSEFNGLTEIGFPQSFVSKTDLHPEQISTPQKVDTTWLANPILFERNEGGLVELDNVKVCNLDGDYTKFNQWKVDIGNSCNASISVVTAGTVTFNPMPYQGMTIKKIVGALLPLNFGPTSNIWIIYPRSSDDLVLQ